MKVKKLSKLTYEEALKQFYDIAVEQAYSRNPARYDDMKEIIFNHIKTTFPGKPLPRFFYDSP